MKVSKKTVEHYLWGGSCDGWRLVDKKVLSIIHERMPGGTSEVRHYHQHSQQFFFVLSGNPTLEVDGERYSLSEHEGIEVPPLVPHQMFNDSNEDAEFLVISKPNTRGDRILVD
ncbi:cupin domain-containing protein [Neobacillus sp. Marseille-QA0830]